MTADLLDLITSGSINQPFALIGRRWADQRKTRVDVMSGQLRSCRRLEDLQSQITSPLAENGAGGLLALVPFRQISEAGYDCHDDGESLRAIEIERRETYSLGEALERLPSVSVVLHDMGFDIEDAAYAGTAKSLIENEIGQGEGSNFVLSRSVLAHIENFSTSQALSVFRRLLSTETGAYWTFVISTGDRVLIGASPEQQITLREGVATMNPISGTYAYPPAGASLEGLIAFLENSKETDELYMVADEELKMFSRFCDQGGRLSGPFLKEMHSLAHTEYFIRGNTNASPWVLLRDTMMAPTVTGSPLKSACSAIKKYEATGRGYYAGIAALIDHDDEGREQLDSAILIRTADIRQDGLMRVRVGATIVRHSDPIEEAAETRAKANTIINSFSSSAQLREHPQVKEALAMRNNRVAPFWLGEDARFGEAGGRLSGRALIIDAEDAFTQMLAKHLAAIGLEATICQATEDRIDLDAYDVIIFGPGPGDPQDLANPCVLGIKQLLGTAMRCEKPFVAVCLSHQILCSHFGLRLMRHDRPRQGLQRQISFFGSAETVGFYNTFSAVSAVDTIATADGKAVEVCRDTGTGEVYGLRGQHFGSLQFHAESILSLGGIDVLKRELDRIMPLRLQSSVCGISASPTLP